MYGIGKTDLLLGVLLVLVCLVATITRQPRPFIQAWNCNFIPVI